MRSEKAQNGIATLEMVILAPVFALLLMAIADFGRLARDNVALTAAVNAGARYGSFDTANYLNDAGIVNAVVISGSDLPVLSDNVSVSPRQCFCIQEGVTLIGMPSCSSACLGDGIDPLPAKYLTVSAVYRFTPMFSWPALHVPVDIHASSTIRAQ